MPIVVAANVPIGIDFLGSLRSPESPTPAVIPVKAGNTIANILKKSPWSFIHLKVSGALNPSTGPPAKNITSETARIATTMYKTAIPLLAPLVSISQESSSTEMIPIAILLMVKGRFSLI